MLHLLKETGADQTTTVVNAALVPSLRDEVMTVQSHRLIPVVTSPASTVMIVGPQTDPRTIAILPMGFQLAETVEMRLSEQLPLAPAAAAATFLSRIGTLETSSRHPIRLDRQLIPTMAG